MFEIFYKANKEDKLLKLEEFRAGSLVVLEEPTKEEVANVTAMLGLDEDLMHDAQDPHEVPHIETEQKVTYLFTRMPYEAKDGNAVTTYPVLVAIGEEFVLALFQKKTPLIEKLRSGAIEYQTTEKITLLFKIISEVNTSFSRFIININRGVRKATVDFRSISNSDIVNFLRFESTLNDFLGALVPTSTLLNELMSGKHLSLSEDERDLIEDNLLANGQLIETSKNNVKNILNIRDAYSTIMTNNLNRVIRILTALTIALTVPTMISSFFGMNVPLPFAHSPSAFWIILGVTILLSAGLLVIFARKKWL